MTSDQEFQQLKDRVADWRAKQSPDSQRRPEFRTPSQLPVDQVYTAVDTARDDRVIGDDLPGEFPYLRGIHESGYRGRLWTLRMFAGFGRPKETNERFKFLLEQGQTGLSVAFDMPTLYGYDTDDPRALGEFGTCGVAVSSLADMETLFDGIKLDSVTTSMTINAPAAIIWAMYIALAEKQGTSLDRIGGTIQNDILKEYIAQNEYIFPPKPSMRAGYRHGGVCRKARAALEPHQHQRLPYPGGGLQRGAGTGVYPRRRIRVRAACAGTGTER